LPPTGPVPGNPCAHSLDAYRERVAGEDSIPEWAAVDCFTGNLQRKPMPAFIKRYNMEAGQFARMPREGQLQWAHFDTASSLPVVNFSSGMFSGIPPFWDLMQQKGYEYPLSPTYLDRKLRGAAPFFLTDKMKGWRTLFVQFYPPGTAVAGVVDVPTYKQWVMDHLVPEKVAEAKYAERLKFEAFMPFPAEVEIMINTLPFTQTIPVEERVALAQWLADTIRTAVRPHYAGHLIAPSYTRFEVTGEAWNKLSFAGWDSVAFGVFPECNLEETRRYMAAQLPHWMTIVASSGGIRWTSGEIFVKPQHFINASCLTEQQYLQAEPMLYQAIIDAIESASVKPTGFLPDRYLIRNPETLAVIERYWASKPD
jgi:hypothetical protein